MKHNQGGLFKRIYRRNDTKSLYVVAASNKTSLILAPVNPNDSTRQVPRDEIGKSYELMLCTKCARMMECKLWRRGDTCIRFTLAE